MLRRVVWWILTDVSEELTASIIRALIWKVKHFPGCLSNRKFVCRLLLFSTTLRLVGTGWCGRLLADVDISSCWSCKSSVSWASVIEIIMLMTVSFVEKSHYTVPTMACVQNCFSIFQKPSPSSFSIWCRPVMCHVLVNVLFPPLSPNDATTSFRLSIANLGMPRCLQFFTDCLVSNIVSSTAHYSSLEPYFTCVSNILIRTIFFFFFFWSQS
jgi:hypothetical protein